jgi:hypothetical protein
MVEYDGDDEAAVKIIVFKPFAVPKLHNKILIRAPDRRSIIPSEEQGYRTADATAKGQGKRVCT